MTQLQTDFDAHADSLWEQLAPQIQPDFIEDRDWIHDRLIVGEAEWKVALDCHEHAGYRSTSTYTRFHAPYVSDNPFSFLIRHEALSDRIGKLLGEQDVEVGDSAVDHSFLLQSNSGDRLRKILSREPLRVLLRAEPEVVIVLHDDHGYWQDHYPTHTRDVAIEVHGHEKDAARLERLYRILAEIMMGICATRGETS
jgi:hypothetical protein